MPWSARFNLWFLRFASGLSLVFLAASSPGISQAVPGASQARITAPVDDSVLTPLKGNVSPLAIGKYDQGPANASLPADRLQLVLQRSPEQEFALRQFLGAAQDKNSPQYRNGSLRNNSAKNMELPRRTSTR